MYFYGASRLKLIDVKQPEADRSHASRDDPSGLCQVNPTGIPSRTRSISASYPVEASAGAPSIGKQAVSLPTACWSIALCERMAGDSDEFVGDDENSIDLVLNNEDEA